VPDFDPPGVCIEEVSFDAETIEGVATSTTAFVGEADEAVVNVRSVADFERAFGGVHADFELGMAVSLFFANGGRDAWVVGVPGGTPLAAGLQRFDAVETLNLLCLPGERDADVLGAALEYADRRRGFLVVDPAGTDLYGTTALANTLALSGSANGAMYFPPLEVADPGGVVSVCPPSGAVAGMYARVDGTAGVWQAPAGSNGGLSGVAVPAVRLDQDALTKLHAAGVNPIRRFPSRGIQVWGARTLQGGEGSTLDWKYVPVRRVALFIEESLYRGTEWAVFEPNDEPLWAKLRRECGVFLLSLFRSGAFPGRTPDEAYFVRCGRDTMTQDDIDSGRLTILIGIAPVRPAEFVIIRIGQWMAESTETFDAAGSPSERLCLREHPVAAASVVVQVKEGTWATWRQVRELADVSAGERAYSLDAESGKLTFGDGDHGARLPTGSENVRVAYRHGAGTT
jgi:Bacteriophage tail sheath protein